MQLCPHLTFSGQCETAFRFYERSLGAKIDSMLSYGNSPMAPQVPSGWRDKIVHASLTLGDKTLAGADVLPEQYEKPQGFYVLLGVADPVGAERIFHTLAKDGVIQMPFQKTFWSPGFGVVVDQFAIPWEISCEQASSVQKSAEQKEP